MQCTPCADLITRAVCPAEAAVAIFSTLLGDATPIVLALCYFVLSPGPSTLLGIWHLGTKIALQKTFTFNPVSVSSCVLLDWQLSKNWFNSRANPTGVYWIHCCTTGLTTQWMSLQTGSCMVDLSSPWSPWSSLSWEPLPSGHSSIPFPCLAGPRASTNALKHNQQLTSTNFN